MCKIFANILYLVVFSYIFFFGGLSTFSNVVVLFTLLVVICSIYTNIKNFKNKN